MGILQDYLLNDETYEDGLKRALRCWSNEVEKGVELTAKVEELKAELRVLRQGSVTNPPALKETE